MPVPITQSASPAKRMQQSDGVEEVESLYNSAVQSFVRRDHVKTQATLSRLLEALPSLRPSIRAWYDLEASPEEDWVIKSLKLVISSHTSLYSDPPKDRNALPPHIQSLLPPTPPSSNLNHLAQTCSDIYGSITSPTTLLPPQLISTLLLASLNLRPLSSTLPFAHQLAETWLSTLPDNLLSSLHSTQRWSPGDKKRIEGMREGYLKVVELFVGEVLVREKEWEMARGLLDGEELMSSKRKEVLYKHIRERENRSLSAASLSSSMVLPVQSPSSSSILAPAAPLSSNSKTRSRSSSASSSSSEKTARPGTNGVVPSMIHGNTPSDRKGKGRVIQPSIASESTLPSRIILNHPQPDSPQSKQNHSQRSHSPHSSVEMLKSAIALLPSSLQRRLIAFHTGSWPQMLIPLPILTAVIVCLAIRRRSRRGNGVSTGATLAAGGIATAETVVSMRDRLRQVRERGVTQWLRRWIMWWLQKITGVWRMGTTITYV